MYKMRDDIKKETIAIEIQKEEYAGVVFRFTTVSVKEEEDKQNAIITFEYDIINPGKLTETALRGNVEFQNYLGSILHEIITKSLDDMEENVEPESADRKSNSKKSDKE